MNETAVLSEQFLRDGFALIEEVLDSDTVESLKDCFEHASIARSEREGETFGARNLFSISTVREAAHAPRLQVCLRSLLGGDIRAVRGIFFDKTENANWPVPWHQDLTIAVRERVDLAGWTNWTIKRGVVHVQPPLEILQRMITVRLHIDDCPTDNGPLRAIGGTHRHGRLAREDIRAIAAAETESVLCAKSGDALFMRPLLLHASSPARVPKHRRVLHLEFAPMQLLPSGLDWATAI
jgi:ectoine hydroxylase-related dioxygenase (phytanoyl-CoA dioxygenase family)